MAPYGYRYLGQRKCKFGKMYWITGWPFYDLDPKSWVMAVAMINKNLLVCMIKWEPLTKSLQNWSCLSPESLEEFCWRLWGGGGGQILDVFFLGLMFYWPYLKEWLVQLIIWKGNTLVGYWVSCMILTFDLTHDIHLWIFLKVEVWNSLISGMGRLIDMEGKGCELITHDHNSDLRVTIVGWMDVRDSDWGGFRRSACSLHI